MGIIKKQSIQSTILTYLGVFIGFINSAVLLPYLFNPEEVGLLGFLNSLSSIFATLATFGIPLITIKMFPYFRSEESNHNGFFSFIILSSLAGIVLGTLIYFGFESSIITGKNSAKDFIYFNILFFIVFAGRVLFRNLDGYIRMLYNTVLGSALEGLGVKLLIFITLLIYWITEGFTFNWVVICYSIALASSGLISLFYSLTTNISLNLRQFKKTLGKRKKELYTIGLYGALGSIGTIIVLEIDRIMVSNMLGLEANGVYSVAFFFGLFVSLPSRGLRRIASVIISDSWKENDLDNIDTIYKKSCSNQLLISGYLFLGIWFSMDYLFEFMKPEYASGKWVVFFIGISQIIDMITGVNGEIIITSKFYKYNTYFVAGLIIGVIGLNYVFIPLWGITGSAIASLLAMTFINILRYIFLLAKFNFQPFSIKILINVVLILVIYFILELIPTAENGIIGILISGTVLTIIYWPIAYYAKISEDMNISIEKTFRRFLRK